MSSRADPPGGATGDGGPAGLVLCGGSSSRMGTDKALLGGPGRPLAARVAGVLAGAGLEPVVLVGGDGAALAGHGHPWRADARPGWGPLVAVADALDAAGARDPDAGRPVVVAACDLPWLTVAAVTQLLAAVADGAPAVVAELDGVPQWSLLALGPEGARAVRRAAASGERAFHRALAGTVVVVGAADPGALRDVDHPEDVPPFLRRGDADGRAGTG